MRLANTRPDQGQRAVPKVPTLTRCNITQSHFFTLCELIIVLSEETMERAVDVSKQ